MLTPGTNGPPGYAIIIPPATLRRVADYLQALQERRAEPGRHLGAHLRGVDLHALTTDDLLARLFDTRRPQIFAESAVTGDGSDWNLHELGLLGDISVAVAVTVFDDGHHHQPKRHEPPFQGMLVYTPGALLQNGWGHLPADWNEAVGADGGFALAGYRAIYRRRLLPVLRYINDHAGRPRSAFVTVPGLGCGQFAGPFRGQLGPRLREALLGLLHEFGDTLPNVKAVYFDPYSECDNFRCDVAGIAFMVRPLTAPGNRAKPQLCRPVTYAEPGDDFADCTLYSVVAWDHVSWPGNDFFMGARATDDGVKAAATSSMAVITGVAGHYDPSVGKYQPPAPCSNWAEVVESRMRSAQLRLWNARALWR